MNRAFDVLCVGMFRACSTWQYNVAADLVERHRGGARVGYLSGDAYRRHVRARGAGAPPRWEVLKSHVANRPLARALRAGRALGLYSDRDVRDVAFSMMHKLGCTFEQYVSDGSLHQLLLSDRWWRSCPRVLVQHYDELVAEPARGVAQIAAWLGIALGEGEAESLASAHSREANLAKAERLRAEVEAKGVDVTDPEQRRRVAIDRGSMLHWNHLRGDRSPRWQELAGPVERLTLAKVCGGWLIRRGFEPDRAWAREAEAVPEQRRAAARLAARGLWATRRRRYHRAVAALRRAVGRPPANSPVSSDAERR